MASFIVGLSHYVDTNTYYPIVIGEKDISYAMLMEDEVITDNKEVLFVLCSAEKEPVTLVDYRIVDDLATVRFMLEYLTDKAKRHNEEVLGRKK